MAYDWGDLLARAKAMALRPATDERMDDPQWYRFLNDAQVYWIGQLAIHAPAVNYGPPELMTTADGGLTYSVTNYPLGHMEIRARRDGPLLIPGPEWDPRADFTEEGQTIRIPGGRARNFAGLGPWARYVAVPNEDISGQVEPVMKPEHMRVLMVPRACYLYASQGGVLDPATYLAEEQRLWCGDPRLAGDTGFLGQLKTQYFGAGAAAVSGDGGAWYQNADFGVGRV